MKIMIPDAIPRQQGRRRSAAAGGGGVPGEEEEEDEDEQDEYILNQAAIDGDLLNAAVQIENGM